MILLTKSCLLLKLVRAWIYVIWKQKSTKLYKSYSELTFYNSRLDKWKVWFTNAIGILLTEIKGTLSIADILDLYILFLKIFKQLIQGKEYSAYSVNAFGTGKFSSCCHKAHTFWERMSLDQLTTIQCSRLLQHQPSESKERHYLIPLERLTDSYHPLMFNPSKVKE